MTLYQSHRVESARLRGWDYASPGWYFVTICTHNHACHFGKASDGQVTLSRMGQIAESELLTLPKHYVDVRLDARVVMPNHVHIIVVIDGTHAHSPNPPNRSPDRNASPSLGDIIGSYKAGVTRICRREGFRSFAWQTRYHDHIIRTNGSLNAIRDYVQNNPRNWLQDEENPRRDAACRVSRGVRLL